MEQHQLGLLGPPAQRADAAACGVPLVAPHPTPRKLEAELGRPLGGQLELVAAALCPVIPVAHVARPPCRCCRFGSYYHDECRSDRSGRSSGVGRACIPTFSSGALMTDTTTSARKATPLIGDALPASLATYYDHLDHGRMEEATRCFAADVVYALPPADGSETGPRVITVGTDALLARFNERGPKPWSHHVELCTVDGAVILLEGVLIDATTGATTGTYLASTHLDADGLIDRYLAYFCSAPGWRSPGMSNPTGSRTPGTSCTQYFAAMDRGDFPAAAARFTSDVLAPASALQAHGHRQQRPRRVRRPGSTRSGLHRPWPDRVRPPDPGVHPTGAPLHHRRRGREPARRWDGQLPVEPLADAAGTIRRYVSFYCEPGLPWA